MARKEEDKREHVSNGNAETTTETTPLLSKGASAEIINDGIGAGGPVPVPVPANGTIKRSDVEQDGDDTLERQASADDDPPEYQGLPEVKKKMKYIFPAVAIGVALAAADQTIVISSKERIGSELNSLSMTSWISTAYLLAMTCSQPLYGKMADIFGRRACLLFGYTFFGIGCLGCGLAQNIEQLIAARAVTGIGGGSMTTVVSILLSDVFTLRERGPWQGYINIIYAAGSGAGAPLGGLVCDTIGWRWAFLIQTPLSLVAILAVAVFLKLPSRDDASWIKKLKRIDYLGAVILILALFLLLLALDRGGNVGWTAPIAYVPLAVSMPLLILFAVVEMKYAAEPLAPGRIIFSPSIFGVYALNFFTFGSWMAALFYVPLFYQVVDHVSPTGAGLRLIPPVIAGVVGSLVWGIYIKKTGRYKWPTVILGFGTLVGQLMLFLTSGPLITNTVLMIVAICVAGFSTSGVTTTSLIGLIANATPADQAIATACSFLFRALGSVVGISLSATAANFVLRQSLADQLGRLDISKHDALEIADKVRSSLAVLNELSPRVREVVEHSFATSANAAFGVQLVFTVGAAVSAWFVKEKKLGK